MFDEHRKNFKQIIADVIAKSKIRDNIELEQLLLSIIYKLDNVELIDFEVQKTINKEYVQRLINIQCDINNLEEEILQIQILLESNNKSIGLDIENTFIINESNENLKDIIRR